MFSIYILGFAASWAFGPIVPHRASKTMVSDFTCNKKAFYPTVAGGSGIRYLMLPQGLCPAVTDVGEMLEHLCCANTHVVCTDEVETPVLISYDGGLYPMPNDATKVLDTAYSRLCSMMMADKCGDCKMDTCALFAAKPETKSCYGKSYTDSPDGSGFHNTTRAKAAALRTDAPAAACRPVKPVPTLNTSEYLRATWYIQQQQVTGYQSKDDLFCVAQTFTDGGSEHKVPFYSGKVVAVYNYANAGEVNGDPVNTANGTVLCARQTDPSDPARLINAPCFLPNLLAGDYWVVGAGPSPERYDWAIVSAGTPTVQYDDGCTTKLTGTNGAGLWLFHRARVAPKADIDTMRSMLSNMGYTLSQLLNVPQDGCRYEGAFIKPNVY